MMTPYSQVLLTNVVLAATVLIYWFDGPPVPVIAGALGGGALVRARARRRGWEGRLEGPRLR